MADVTLFYMQEHLYSGTNICPGFSKNLDGVDFTWIKATWLARQDER